MILKNFSKIILDLAKNSKTTIEEVVERTNIPRHRVSRIITALVKEKVIQKNASYYTLSETFLNLVPNQISDVYFNLKIKQEHKDMIYFLFLNLENYMIKTIGLKPTLSTMQRMVVKLNNNLSLNLPIVNYKDGQIIPVIYDPNKKYSELIKTEIKNIPEEEIYNVVNKHIVENANLKKVIMPKKFEDHLSDLEKLYIIKDQIFEDIYFENYTQVYEKSELIIDLRPRFKHEFNLINDYLSFLVVFRGEQKRNKTTYFKNLLLDAYNCYWNYIAIHLFIKDMTKYYEQNGFNTNEINEKTAYKIKEIKTKFDLTFDKLYEFYNLLNLVNNKETLELFDKIMADENALKEDHKIFLKK